MHLAHGWLVAQDSAHACSVELLWIHRSYLSPCVAVFLCLPILFWKVRNSSLPLLLDCLHETQSRLVLEEASEVRRLLPSWFWWLWVREDALFDLQLVDLVRDERGHIRNVHYSRIVERHVKVRCT